MGSMMANNPRIPSWLVSICVHQRLSGESPLKSAQPKGPSVAGLTVPEEYQFPAAHHVPRGVQAPCGAGAIGCSPQAGAQKDEPKGESWPGEANDPNKKPPALCARV